MLEPYPIVGELFDAFHAQSDFAAHAFTFFTRPVTVIKGPVDDEAFPLSSMKRDSTLVVAVGRILSHKGFENIIDRLPEALTLVIVGRPYDGDYLAYLRERARHKRVLFETNLDDGALLRLVQSAGLHVHASQHTDFRGNFALKPELLGLAPLECLATGMPAITSTAGSLAELGSLEGCYTYSSGDELAGLLAAYADGRLPLPSPVRIRQGVLAAYGLKQFGLRYLDLLRKL
jgi:glycosyltransferase involved in cell wall biosynthesis